MTGLLLQIGATKLAVSVVLAGAAWVVCGRVGGPAVAHRMWLLVLVVLLVPAVVSLPVLPGVPREVVGAADVASGEVGLAERSVDRSRGAVLGALTGPGVAIAWLLGAIGLLGWSLARMAHFRRTLARASRPAAAGLQREAAAIGRQLGLARIPEVRTTDARVTPMVWWTGGEVRVLVPAWVLADLTRDETRAILAHELAHVRRRDHLVRWLEWLACSVFWWNPVAWWARRRLRIAEEACCDRLALDAAGSPPRTYANALLRVVANASRPAGFHPPLPASTVVGVGSTKTIERRLRMIVSTDTRSPTPRPVRAATWVAVLCALPFGLVYCDRPSAVQEEAATETEALESAEETFDGDLADILTRYEEGIHRKIRERVKAGDLDEHAGRVLSAYVSGAKAGLLVRHMDRNLSVEEKKRAAEELTESADWDELDSHAAATTVGELILKQAAGDLARLVRMPEIVRPHMPVIWRLHDTLIIPDSIGVPGDGRNREDSRPVLELRDRPTTDVRLTSADGLFDTFPLELRKRPTMDARLTSAGGLTDKSPLEPRYRPTMVARLTKSRSGKLSLR